MQFEDLNLAEPILRSIREKGYEHPTPIQEKAVPEIMAGRDVIGSAQTGTGKTAAFALPILHRLATARKGEFQRCLVLCPTRELALQAKENFVIYGCHLPFRTCVIYGGVGYGQQKDELTRNPEIVIATPGRLLDLMQQGVISLSQVRMLVLDEVDRMLDMGFIDDVRRIVRKCPKDRQTLLFSATIPEEVGRLANWALREPIEITIGIRLSPADTVRHVLLPVGALQKFDLLIALLNRIELSRTIIFCRMRRGADRVGRWLQEHGYSVAIMHSDLNQNERQKALADFKEGRLSILTATDIASRGLDIASVTHVINYDVPQHSEDYVHRIGRTGRAASEGSAYTLVSPDETSLIAAIEKLIEMPIAREKLEGFPYRYDPILATEKPAPVRKRRNRGFARS